MKWHEVVVEIMKLVGLIVLLAAFVLLLIP